MKNRLLFAILITTSFASISATSGVKKTSVSDSSRVGKVIAVQLGFKTQKIFKDLTKCVITQVNTLLDEINAEDLQTQNQRSIDMAQENLDAMQQIFEIINQQRKRFIPKAAKNAHQSVFDGIKRQKNAIEQEKKNYREKFENSMKKLKQSKK